MKALALSNRLATIVDVLRERAARQPGKIAYRFLADDDAAETTETYADLDRRAKQVAAFLRSRYAAGERVLLLYPPGLDYIAALFGCMYAGVIAVPSYPQSSAKMRLPDARLRTMAVDCEPLAALGPRATMDMLAGAIAGDPALQRIQCHATDDLDPSWADAWKPMAIDARQVAFLQYTSGSTSLPRGVRVTHGNLLHNEALIRAACQHTEESAFVGWLPFYHDMGLIGNILQPLYLGSESTLLSPLAFLQKPLRWLSAITRYHAATSGGPNFAYDYCVRRVTAEERAALDLRSWTLAFNGAEPIRADTHARFIAAFEPCGFDPSAFYPVYGLAEATLMVSAARRRSLPVTRSFDTNQMQCGIAQPVDDDASGRTLVSSGRPVEGQEQTVAIVDAETRIACAAGRVGEIWISGPSVADGYWNRPAETEETFRATRVDEPGRVYLRTGDLGFLLDGELFVTGRLKDLIILRGQNHYPQDIERTVERSHPGLRAGGGAAFSLERDGGETFGIVHEIERSLVGRPLTDVVHQIRRAVAEEHALEPYAVVLIPPGHLPKTSSGKVRRAACRTEFESGQFETLACDIRPVSNGEGSNGDGSNGDALAERAAAASAATLPDATSSPGIRRIVAELLAIPADAIDDDRLIGELGLDSLRIIELRHRIETISSVALPFTLRLDELTIRDLADTVLRSRTAPITPAIPAPPHTVRADRGDLQASQASHGQRGLWLLEQIAPDSTAYNIFRSVRITGPLNRDAMRSACEALWARYPVLRSRFVADANGIVRTEASDQAWLDIDDALLTEPAMIERLQRESRHLFSLRDGPLFRVLLLTLGDDDHVLALNMHHIVADLASVGVLLRDLMAHYSASVRSTAAVLPPVRVDFEDYARWQAELLSGPEGERLETYWRTQLAAPLSPLALPYDRPHRTPPRLEGRWRDFELSGDLLTSLRAAGVRTRATLFSVLLAAFDVLMHRITRQEDIVVGVPCAGRSKSDLADVVGYLVNLAPVRVRVSGDLRFEEMIERVHDRVQDALAHQDYPFATMVERVPAMRDASGRPVINTLFTLQAFPGDLTALAPLTLGVAGGKATLDAATTVTSMATRQDGAQFDLAMSLTEHDDRLLGSLAYNTDVFDEASVERLVQGFSALVERAVRSPESTVGELIGLSASERRLLRGWNTTATDHRAPASLVACIDATCDRVPEALAVSDERVRLNYRALDARANQLARHLATHGARREAVVAVCLPRSVDLEVTLLAVLKAGAAFLPLDPLEPPMRLRTMIEDARPCVIVTSHELADRLPRHVPICALDDDASHIDRVEASRLTHAPLEGQSAYVLFTSGSTGQPKGVVNTHDGILNRLLWMQHAYRLTTDDRVLQKTPCTFDVSVWEFFWPLMAGSSIVMARPEGHRDTSYLADVLLRERITTVHFVPSQLRVLLREPRFDAGALRLVICSGEALTQDLQDEFFERLPGVELHNLYGPTEAAIDVTASRCRPGVPVTIGRPIANTSAWILDAHLNPVPPGTIGELCIGGVAPARGYLHRPGLTADRFVPHPLDQEGGERLYRTGDLARWTAAGDIVCLGRLDTQIKIRGARVELGEIEAALRALPGVHDAAVMVVDDPGGLTAFVACESDEPLAGWRVRLRERLSDHMVPSALIRLDALPLTRNGKLDRGALSRLASTATYASTVESSDERSWTPLEQQLAPVWSELFGRPVGLHDNFFDLGGHSLLATQLVSRIRDSLHCDVPVALIFSEGVTVARLAACIEQQLLDEAGDIPENELHALLADSPEA